MNMSIASAPVSTGKAPAQSNISVAGSGSGFAGVLIQAIDGTSQTAAANNGLSLPLGLTSLFGQMSTDNDDSIAEAQDLLELLTQLMNQLQQLEQSYADELSPDTEEQLTASLIAFQGLLQQMNQSLPPADIQSGSVLSSQATSESVDTELESQLPAASVVKALRESLQQLSTLIASTKDSVPLATNFVSQLKALLDSIPALAANTTLTGAATVDKEASTQTATKAANATVEVAAAAPQEAMNQTTAIVQEIRRPLSVLRDPIWRSNVAAASESAEKNNPTAVTAPVTAAEEAGSSNSQPAWTFMSNDPLANSESTAGKASLPVHVPVQQFAEQMGKFLIKQFQLTQGNGVSEAKLTLTPEHLGQVDIRIVMQNGQLTAHFMTENAMARDLLENQMSQLRSALNGQGLQVERLEVVQQPASSASTSFMQHDQRQSSSGNGNGSNGRNNGDSYEDPAVFAAELERTSFLKEFGFGSSINVTA